MDSPQKTSLKLVYTLRQLLLSHPMALTLTSVMTMALFGLISHVPIKLKIAPGKTACFLCRREELLFGYDEAHNHYQPNLNLVLFVKKSWVA